MDTSEFEKDTCINMEPLIHFTVNERSDGGISLKNLILSEGVMGMSDQVVKKRDCQITAAAPEARKDEYGTPPDQVVALFLTRLGDYCLTPIRSMGINLLGSKVVSQWNSSVTELDTVRWLRYERSVDIIEIDTGNLNYYLSGPCESPQKLFQENVIKSE